ncbi:hypothetical protein Trco_007093 [Trichoderma cornu-damae]|uniref:N-methyltransferase n=1 Tax=Trichoderma cornu-damae TaxID=654480 RepID=A0A9P8QHT6_9HYPO|nr:hypothetical protein Trco_007093 [Trichoderma cornu-damae]
MPAVRESVLLEQQLLTATARALDIVDIQKARVEIDLKDEILTQMNPEEGPRTLPTLLLYDERGLQLFEDITYLDEYYLTNYEMELLKKSSVEIASGIPEGSMVVELGSGNLRKVCLLLQAFEEAKKHIDYFALDLSQTELERTLAEAPAFKYVTCRGLRGTYDDGCEWLKQPAILARPKCILHLGSSIGNFNRDEAADFLRSFAEVLQPTDLMIVGVDSCQNPDKVYKGVTHQFVLNGLTHANEILGEEAFNVEEWKVIGEYVYDVEGGRHQAFVSPLEVASVLGHIIKPHERIKIEQSLKYSDVGVDKLWKTAGLQEVARWSCNGEYGLHMLKKAKMPFARLPALYAKDALPVWADWESLWSAWDTVTRKMLPDAELNEKPIKLRNACIFYLGHIPAFLDIQLKKTTKAGGTEPLYFHAIFERGIDPDVDNPEKCHDHSEIPDEWPALEDILTYQDRVRQRLRRLYSDPEQLAGDVRRAVWMGFEHEVLHLETLLYMLLQSDKTLPPPHTAAPDFPLIAQKAYAERVPNQWFDIPEQVVTIGMDDPEDEDEPDAARHFGWDNEKPSRQERVHAFQAKGRPITNEEARLFSCPRYRYPCASKLTARQYAKYLYASQIDSLPASWSVFPPNYHHNTNATTPGKPILSELPESYIQDKAVRTVYGLVPLRYALDWPVFASYDELAGCASWMGGRIPTMEETKSIYAHLVNDGVEETPPSTAITTTAATTSSSLFIDLGNTNTGFLHWHPVPVTPNGASLAGQGDMGGVWEWTSTILRPHQGFRPMAMYPGYTADFFDEKHNVVLGGSWATHSRVAGRKSFVNWYQRNYLYAWVGARLVRDV